MNRTSGNPRALFFNEEGTMIPPFRGSGWRGCAINRDRFDHTNMPRELFEAIVHSASSPYLLLARYSPDSEGSERITPEWEAFRAHVFNAENWALEFVLYDPTERWAILADADVTVFGAEPALAAHVDQALSTHALSLARLTDRDFPDLNPMSQPGAPYLLAVSGRWPCDGKI
ncbi:hypothetical protein [Pseudomarimonas salicorniae]|uniref:Uncharacterized protein n=1 Tax=Pseudomarimonas salicorniae TaxID=2933270 RepID=A0ABT0GM59_9GAMM|nr:hypothetical protein [Lysobacter sp. CAU 1642]MCK7595625.1 hypothetical protein [Lysobacter sp. CAU 1642]